MDNEKLIEEMARALAKRHGFGDKSPYIADAQAALAAHNAAIEAAGFMVVPGWRDIADAPRDGTKFDAWVPDAFGGRRMCDLSFNAKGQLRQHGLLTEADLPRWPTHFMPLPAAPNAGRG